jgi:hypothetical protein
MPDNKVKKFFLFLAGILLAIPKAAHAICPICTAAVGVGVLITRRYGIDDMIAGTWVGGMLISVALWTDSWLKGKKVSLKYQEGWLIALYFLLIVLPLYLKGIIGHPLNKICGADKMLVGIIFGSLAFALGNEINLKLKERNGGKAYFPFQKVVLAVVPLIVMSIVFYVVSKC